jgi:hypothetical protein
MKYTALFAVTTAAVASAQTDAQRNLATLAEKWNLTEPVFAFDSNTFTLTFPVTDYINTGMASYSLWTAPDCQSSGGTSLQTSDIWAEHTLNENTALAAASDFDKESAGYSMLDSGVFNGREAIVSAEFDPQTISASQIYTQAVNDDNQMIAEIVFCVRFGLWTTSSLGVTTPVEVNFLETLITLTVDLTDGFQIGAINVQAKERLIRTANQAYEVRGYECSQLSTDPLTDEEKARPRNQGEIIHVCVTPEEEAQTDGIFMRSIDDFTFTRGTTIQQLAIENNAEAGNLLTSYSSGGCIGTLVCKFSTILFAQFYATPGTVAGAGVATMQFGNTRRRALRTGGDARELQDQAGAAEFDMQFDVTQADARVNDSGASQASLAAVMSMVAIAVAMI